MNCTEHTRYLGRSLTLATSEGQVQQVNHQESMPGRAMFSAMSSPTQRDDICIRFEDGQETSIKVFGRGFQPKPGQRITAVNATTKRGGSVPLLYCFNQETRKGWTNTDAVRHMRRRAPIRMVIWFLPLFVLFGAWMSPAATRADLATWVEAQSGIASSVSARAGQGDEPAASRRDGSQHRRFDEMLRLVTATVVPKDSSESRRSSVRSLGQMSATFVLDGWRERNWLAFVVVAVVVLVGCSAVGHVLIVVPSTMRFRRQIKRLAKQHRRATTAS